MNFEEAVRLENYKYEYETYLSQNRPAFDSVRYVRVSFKRFVELREAGYQAIGQTFFANEDDNTEVLNLKEDSGEAVVAALKQYERENGSFWKKS